MESGGKALEDRNECLIALQAIEKNSDLKDIQQILYQLINEWES